MKNRISVAEKDKFYVGLGPSYEFNIKNMKEYDFTEKIRDILGKYGLK